METLAQTEVPTLHYIRKIQGYQKNWDTSTRELYAIIFAVEKLRPYLEYAEYEIVTDHKAVSDLTANFKIGSKLARWAQYLSSKNCVIKYLKGSANALADYFSRLGTPEMSKAKKCDLL